MTIGKVTPPPSLAAINSVKEDPLDVGSEWLEWFNNLKLLVNEAITEINDKLPIYTKFGRNKLTKTLTFDDDTGTVSLFTMTGDVFLSLIPVVTTNVASTDPDAAFELGTANDTNAMISSTLVNDLDARDIWVDQTPTTEIEPIDRIRSYIISDGGDVVLTLTGQTDSGAIAFYCFWDSLSSDGNVVAA